MCVWWCCLWLALLVNGKWKFFLMVCVKLWNCCDKKPIFLFEFNLKSNFSFLRRTIVRMLNVQLRCILTMIMQNVFIMWHNKWRWKMPTTTTKTSNSVGWDWQAYEKADAIIEICTVLSKKRRDMQSCSHRNRLSLNKQNIAISNVQRSAIYYALNICKCATSHRLRSGNS